MRIPLEEVLMVSPSTTEIKDAESRIVRESSNETIGPRIRITVE